MCRWLAYSGTPLYLQELITEPTNSLIEQSLHASEAKTAINGDGFGMGWYADRAHPGLYREILPAWADQNLSSLCQQVRSQLFFAHVRASTGTCTSRANSHPFTVGPWLFMHNGQIAEYQRVRRRVEALIPDEVYAKRQGTTDSESLFLALFGMGLTDNPVRAIETLIREVNLIVDQAGIQGAFRFTAALTDGKTLYGFRYSSDAFAPSLYYRCRGTGIVLASEPLDRNDASWRVVPASHVIQVNATEGCEPMIFPLNLSTDLA